MKKTLLALAIGVALLPSAAFAQTVPTVDSRVQFITFLQDQIKVLQARLTVLQMEDATTTEATTTDEVVATSTPEVKAAPVEDELKAFKCQTNAKFTAECQ